MSLGLTLSEVERLVGGLFLRAHGLELENERLRTALLVDEEVGDEGVDSGDIGLEEPARPPD